MIKFIVKTREDIKPSLFIYIKPEPRKGIMAANFLQQLPKLPNFGKFPVPGKLPGLYRPKKSIPEHQAMVQRQASMSLIAPHGLQNLTGENNCFLNSAIQVSSIVILINPHLCLCTIKII